MTHLTDHTTLTEAAAMNASPSRGIYVPTDLFPSTDVSSDFNGPQPPRRSPARMRRPHFVSVTVLRTGEDAWRLTVHAVVLCARDGRALRTTFDLTGDDVVVRCQGRALRMPVGSSFRRRLRMSTLGYDRCDRVPVQVGDEMA